VRLILLQLWPSHQDDTERTDESRGLGGSLAHFDEPDVGGGPDPQRLEERRRRVEGGPAGDLSLYFTSECVQ
jgi:hypothetical protein